MEYIIYDLDACEYIGESFDTIAKAESALCLLAGITADKITDYLSSGDCRYEIRTK